MKLIVILFFIFGVCSALYLFITYLALHFKELKKINWKAFAISAFVGLALMSLVGLAIYTGSKSVDSWCTTIHITNSYPPANLVSDVDYFEKGNFEYDRGNCQEALTDYTMSIELNPNYPEAYNNRAYTYMRMMEYDSALTDLNMALTLDPNYLHALRNRADINNSPTRNKNMSITDYEKIMELAGPSTDVCAHLADAKNPSSSPLYFIPKILGIIKCSKGNN